MDGEANPQPSPALVTVSKTAPSMSAEPLTREHFDKTVGELKDMIAPIAQPKALETLSSEEVMKMLGHSRCDKFWTAVRDARVPFVRVSSRRSFFNRADVEAWMQRKTRNAPP